MKNKFLEEDRERYQNGKMPFFQIAWRKAQASSFFPIKLFWLVMLCFFRRIRMCELPASLQAGGGLLFGHSFCITINPDAKIGSHVNIHKGVTSEIINRGKRQGYQ